MKVKQLLFCMFCLFQGALALAQEQLVVEGAYIPALPPSMQNTAAYFTLYNQGQDAVVLTGARTNIAEQVVLHATIRVDGQLRMSRQDSLAIAPGEMITLESGGLHFMVMGLKSAPAPGDEVDLILEFDGGQELPLSIPVRSLLPEDAAAGMEHQH